MISGVEKKKKLKLFVFIDRYVILFKNVGILFV